MNTSLNIYAVLFAATTLLLTWFAFRKAAWVAYLVAISAAITAIFGLAFFITYGMNAYAVILFLTSAIGFVSFLVLKASQGRFRATANSGEPDYMSLRDYEAKLPRYTFKDVVGMDALKKELLKNIDSVLTEGKNGFLFHGAPGTGKTFIAEALAGEISRRRRVKFMSINFSDLESRWQGQAVEQIRKLFIDAREQGPVVLFVDEAESAMGSRISDGTSGGTSHTSKVNTFLSEINNCRNANESGIILIAATNFLDRIDQAVLRDGRFDFKTEITAPDAKARLNLIYRRCPSDCLFAAAMNEHAANAAEQASNRWEGFNIPRLQNIIDEAAKLARKSPKQEEGKYIITFDMLMKALRTVQGSLGDITPESTKSLDELGFDEDIRTRLQSLSRRMTDIARIEAMGGSVPKGVLFGGPAGTGKSAVAKALAKSSGWAFKATSGNALLNDHTNKLLDEVLAKASELRPCIVFIDEADDIIMDRASNPYGRSATNKLLEAMDGQKSYPDVMFIAATNFPEGLDSAAVRGGRFSEKFEFSTPSESTLVMIIRSFMASKKMAPWHSEFTPEAAAKILNGMSPANANDCMQKAINLVITSGRSKIMLSDLEAVL